jgi:hypothetical protein
MQVGFLHQQGLPRPPQRGEFDHDGPLSALTRLFSRSRPRPRVRPGRACPEAAGRWA